MPERPALGPDGAPTLEQCLVNDALPFAPTVVAGDGHVLVAWGTEVGIDPTDVERQVWG